MKLNKLAAPILAAAAAMLISTAAVAESHEEAIFPLADVQWEEAGIPGVEIVQAWGDDATGAVWLIRMPAGTALPMHTHTNDYWGTPIYGTWVHIEDDGTEVPTLPGDYAFIPGGIVHADRCDGAIQCVILLDFAGPRDVTVVE